MELLNTLISRHSVRTYNGEPLLSSDLEKILKAAKAAPVGLGLYDQMHLTVVNPMHSMILFLFNKLEVIELLQFFIFTTTFPACSTSPAVRIACSSLSNGNS